MGSDAESRTAPMLLLDWEDHCEERGWVEATVPEAEAWSVLCEYERWDADQLAELPTQTPKRVWLRPPEGLENEWQRADPEVEDAREFWEFRVG